MWFTLWGLFRVAVGKVQCRTAVSLAAHLIEVTRSTHGFFSLWKRAPDVELQSTRVRIKASEIIVRLSSVPVHGLLHVSNWKCSQKNSGSCGNGPL